MITICHKRAFLDKIEGKIIRKTARRISFLPFMRDFRLHHTTNRYVHDVVNGEFLATDIEGVESVGAGGAVFEEVFLGFGELLA